MSNDGTTLENIVAEIERRLLPVDFSVEVRRNILNDDGVQIAEFDIEISGRIGSSEIHWLIECRDRPSSGPAPGSWIEQLVGRRQRFGIDRVFAVSTTGFSPGATEFAAQSHIIPRTVDDITSIPDSLFVRDILWTDDDVGVGIDVSFINVEDGTRMAARLHELRIKHHGHWIDAGDFIMSDLENTDVFQNRSDVLATVELLTYTGDGEFDASIRGQPMRIRALTAPLHVTKQSFAGKLLLAHQYSEDDRVIGQVGEFEFDTRDGRQLCRIQIANDENGEQRIVAILPDGSPYTGEFTIP